jgi:hypothetical protein
MKAVGLALALPVVASAVWCSLMRTEVVSPLAPFCGPWAGLLYGHSDCTLGNGAPLWSWLGAAALALAGLLAWRTNGSPSKLRRIGAAVGVVAAASHWCWLALLSVANTTS